MGERRNQEGENYRSGPIGNPENGVIAYHQTEMRNPPHSIRRLLASECSKAIILSRISPYFAAGDTNVGIGPSSPCYLTLGPVAALLMPSGKNAQPPQTGRERISPRERPAGRDGGGRHGPPAAWPWPVPGQPRGW